MLVICRYLMLIRAQILVNVLMLYLLYFLFPLVCENRYKAFCKNKQFQKDCPVRMKAKGFQMRLFCPEACGVCPSIAEHKEWKNQHGKKSPQKVLQNKNSQRRQEGKNARNRKSPKKVLHSKKPQRKQQGKKKSPF